MIRALCFDFDGTLAHFTGDFDTLLEGGFAKLGLDAEHRDALLTEYERQLRKAGAITSLGALVEALERLDLHAEVDLEEVNGVFVRMYCEQMEPLPGAREVLAFCEARLPLALVTNGPADMQRAALRAVGMAEPFQTVVISGEQEVGVRKPDARTFGLACERLGVLPEETLMVGDNLGADVQGALKAGLQAVYMGTEEVVGAGRVADLFELKGWLEARLN